MRQIGLKLDYHHTTFGGKFDNSINVDAENAIIEIKNRLENKEDVFVQFDKNHSKRPGAIAKVKKVSLDDKCRKYDNTLGHHVFQLKWDDRKNTATYRTSDYYAPNSYYLPDYKGNTVWEILDVEKLVEEYDVKAHDRLGRVIEKGNTVVFINARYGCAAKLDLGVVQEIQHKPVLTYRGIREINTKIVIETIATNDDDPVEISKVGNSCAIMVLDDVDLLSDAFVSKLIIDQQK
jgi:hypothetical protein